MIDCSWMGRELARRPIAVKTARTIERDARRSRWASRVIVIGLSLLMAASLWAIGYLIFSLG